MSSRHAAVVSQCTLWAMSSKSPVPLGGGAVVGRGVPGRSLRVTPHPERGIVVLSIWDHDVCRATVRLAPEDVHEVVAALMAAGTISAA